MRAAQHLYSQDVRVDRRLLGRKNYGTVHVKQGATDTLFGGARATQLKRRGRVIYHEQKLHRI